MVEPFTAPDQGAPNLYTRRAVLGFLGREDGLTATDYAILLALVGSAAIAGLKTFGRNMPKPLEEAGKAVKQKGKQTGKKG